jgi:hypothetical protein
VIVEGLSTEYPKLSNYVHVGNFVQHKILSHRRQKGFVQCDKDYCSTEDKDYCPTEGKGYSPTEDKDHHQVSHSHQNQSHPIPIKLKEDPRPLVTASSAIMIVVHSTEVSTLYPQVVISSPFSN